VNGKCVLVTGGSRGIGEAVVRAFAAKGCRVAVGYRNSRERAEALAREVGGIAVGCHVGDPLQVEKMVDNVLENFCQLDILVCNAGVAWQGLLTDMTPRQWREVMETDLDGVFYCCRAVLPHFIKRKAGKIVTLSSMWGQVGASCEVAYSAAKAGVIGFTKALAQEVAPSGITVNCVAPGFISTDMNAALPPEAAEAIRQETPLGRLGTPEDVAAAVVFLASRDADFLTGQVISPNGGLVV
jgi:3-oxoacyl-[acyl-carrier protein] reductase